MLLEPDGASTGRKTVEEKISESDRDVDWKAFTKSYQEFVTAKREEDQARAAVQEAKDRQESLATTTTASQLVPPTHADKSNFIVSKPKVTVYTDENAWKDNPLHRVQSRAKPRALVENTRSATKITASAIG